MLDLTLCFIGYSVLQSCAFLTLPVTLDLEYLLLCTGEDRRLKDDWAPLWEGPDTRHQTPDGNRILICISLRADTLIWLHLYEVRLVAFIIFEHLR